MVGVLHLSEDVDIESAFNEIVCIFGSCSVAMNGSNSDNVKMAADYAPLKPTTICWAPPGAKQRHMLTLLPPPTNRRDPIALLDFAKGVNHLFLLLPADPRRVAVDQEAAQQLQLLRLFGLPTLTALAVDLPATGGHAGDILKSKAAAKKHATIELTKHVATSNLPVFVLKNSLDQQHVLRHVAAHPGNPPKWR